MPVVGNWTVPPERSAAVYDKASEKSSPGYYSVFLDDSKTKVEMTAAARAGMFRFTFPASEKTNLLLDLGRIGGMVEIVGNETVEGRWREAVAGAEISRRRFFCGGVFKTVQQLRCLSANSAKRRRFLIGGKDVEPAARTMTGNYAGAYLQFATTEGEQVLVRIASGTKLRRSGRTPRAEEADWSFERIKREAEDAWAQKLNLIEVTGGTEKEKMLFYSCLYHSFASPRLVARKGEPFTGADGEARDRRRMTAMVPCRSGIPAAIRSCCSRCLSLRLMVDMSCVRSSTWRARPATWARRSMATMRSSCTWAPGSVV